MQSLSDLPFLIFVAVAAATQSIGAVEADAYFRLLERRDWVTCPALVSSLPEAARKYSEHWRQYLAGNFGRSAPFVIHAVRSAASRFSAENAEQLEDDLLHIADALRRAARQPKLPRTPKPGHAFGVLENALRAVTPAASPSDSPATAVSTANAAAPPATSVEWQSAVVTRAQPWESVRSRLHRQPVFGEQ